MSEFTCFPKVHIISDTKSSISEDWITAVAKQSLKPYKFIRDCELNIVIADDKLLKSLNFKHKGINDSTDVLSFNIEPIADFIAVDDNSNQSSSGDYDFVLPVDNTGLIGEVIISIEKVIIQSEEKGISFDEELAILVIHGILHLLGFDHENYQDAEDMEKFADKAFNAIVNNS